MRNAPTWTDRDLEEARVLQRQLRTVFSSKQPFAEEAARAVTRICDRALVTIGDEYCQEMFCEVDSCAQRLLRTGRRNPATIRIVLDAIEHRLRSLEALGRSTDTLVRTEVALLKP